MWLFQASHSAEDDHAKDMKTGGAGGPGGGQNGGKCPEGSGKQ